MSSSLRPQRPTFHWRQLLGWYLIFFILTLVMTWPIAGRLGSHIPGSEGDAWVHLWTFNWVKTALLQGDNVYFTSDLFYPQGTSLLQHNFAWLHIALWLPLQAVVGGPAAYSLIFLAGFAFTGLTTLVLAKYLTGSTAAGFIAGMTAAFWPYALSHHNHPNLIFIGFIPLTLYLIHRFSERPTLTNTLYLATSLALIGMVRWQHFVYAAPLLIGYWLWCWLSLGSGQRSAHFDRLRLRKKLLYTTLALAVSVLILIPLLLPYLLPLFTDSISFSGLDASETASGSTDLLAYLIPSRYHPLWGAWAFNLTEAFTINRVFTPFIGFTVLVLAVSGVIGRPRAVRIWVVMGGLLILLALGPIMHINGMAVMALPSVWLEGQFLESVIRRPDRFNVMLSIPIAITAAYGYTVWQERWVKTHPHLLTAVFSALILFEFVVTYPTFPLSVPQWYDTLSEKEQTAAILDLPIHNRTYDEQYMFYQLQHNKGMVGGHVSRPPDEAFEFINQVPMLNALDFDGEPPSAIHDVGRQLAQLAAQDIDYLILHKQFLSEGKLARWKAWLVIPPTYEDNELVVYETNIRLEQSFNLTPRISILQKTLSTAEIGQDGWLTGQIAWGSLHPLDNDPQGCFALVPTAENGEAARPINLGCQPLFASPTPADGPAEEIVHQTFDLHISPFIPGGTYQLTAQLRHQDQPLHTPQTLGQLSVRTIPRVFERPMPAIETAWRWDNGVRLLGYDIDGERLTLYWQTDGRQARSAVVFLHLVDRSSGDILWQHDASPRDWGYPMTWWDAGEIVSETIELPDLIHLHDRPIQLYLGLYDLETQERLSVTHSQTGRTAEDERVPLERAVTSGSENQKSDTSP